jgi:DNA-binding winged helix-turn-helix (wHTH) protein
MAIHLPEHLASLEERPTADLSSERGVPVSRGHGECALTTTSGMLVFSGIQLDLQNECIWRAGEMIRLQRKTFAVLRYLAERAGRLVTKAELLNALWGNTHVSESVVKTHLNHVRVALRDSARMPRFIETVHCRGYRFIAAASVHPVDESLLAARGTLQVASARRNDGQRPRPAPFERE